MRDYSRSKHLEILRYFYALAGVLVLSVSFAAISAIVSQADEQKQRERLEQFHLRSAMLTTEATSRASDLQREIRLAIDRKATTSDPGAPHGVDRAAEHAIYSLGEAVNSIVVLHQNWRQPVDPFSRTVERAARQFQNLEEATGGREASTDLSNRATGLMFTLFQLERVHARESEELFGEIASAGRRNLRRSIFTAGLVLLVAGMIAARILFLLRARLNEHEQTAQALIERERQFQQASKMEALGSLVGGVAHDFNNLLTAILGNADMLQSEIDPSDRRGGMLLEIQRASERAAGLTRQLLAFSRQQAVDLRVVDLDLLLRDLEPLLRRLIREDIRLVLQFDADVCNVEVDPVQMEQVLINLAVNARDAMPGGGVLTVQATNIRVEPGDLSLSAIGAGDYVRIRVEDTGCGMTPEVLARVFDPFFTTKEPGKGTGLGLSTVHGIVAKNGGHVQVHSDPGAGTRFDVYLPRSDETATNDAADEAADSKSLGFETVLVAEDEPQVRKLVVNALRETGYRVLEARDGAEALQLCTEQREPIHLILSDVVMPEMRGPEMVEQALKLHPEARVVYMSGYAEDEAFAGDSAAGTPLLIKPFKIQRMLHLVRRELNAPQPWPAADALTHPPKSRTLIEHDIA